MPAEPPLAADSAPTRAARGRPRLVAAGFIFAFALSIVTVVLTGLWVRSPSRRGAEPEPAPAAVESAADVERSAEHERRNGASPERAVGVRPETAPTPAASEELETADQ